MDGRGGDGAKIAVRTDQYLFDRGFPPDDIFDFESQAPITLRASLRPETSDLAEGDPPSAASPVEIALRIEHRREGAAISLTHLTGAHGTDVSRAPNEEVSRVLHRLGPRVAAKTDEPRFLLIRADRSVVSDPPIEDATPLVAREPMPPDLGLALHEAPATAAARP